MSTVDSLHLSHTQAMRLPAPPEAVFPLLCPVREAEWLRGWTARMVHSRSGLAERGCVFTTPGHGAPDWIWVVTRHEAARAVQFIVLAPDSHVTQLDITLESEPTGTRATWTYALTALDPVKDADHRAYMAGTPGRILDLEARLAHFLRAGSCL